MGKITICEGFFNKPVEVSRKKILNGNLTENYGFLQIVPGLGMCIDEQKQFFLQGGMTIYMNIDLEDTLEVCVNRCFGTKFKASLDKACMESFEKLKDVLGTSGILLLPAGEMKKIYTRCATAMNDQGKAKGIYDWESWANMYASGFSVPCGWTMCSRVLYDTDEDYTASYNYWLGPCELLENNEGIVDIYVIKKRDPYEIYDNAIDWFDWQTLSKKTIKRYKIW